MTALPSFVELMASLGLDNEAQPLEGPGVSPSRAPHSRTSSIASAASGRSSPHSRGVSIRRLQSSPSIVVTQPGVRSSSSDGRRRTSPTPRTRYSPYAAPIDLRRGSMPALCTDEEHHDIAGHRRSNSSSPRTNGRKPPALRIAGVHRRRQRLSAADADLELATPISSLARRKSPQASPTSAYFPARVQESPTFPITPVSVPTLPPAVFAHLHSFSFPTSEDDEPARGGLYAHSTSGKERSARTGVRISASHGRLGGDSDDERPDRR